jgi:enoyl-CoA hydratase/carnithine racemase
MTKVECVRLTIENRTARLELTRPEVLNAIDDRVCDQLMKHMDAIVNDSLASVVVIHGAGERAFSAGADLTFMRNLVQDGLRRFIEKTWIVFDRIATAPIVSIAALHGYVLGGGAEIALACDFRVIETNAQIGFPEMTLGSVPGSGAMQRLPRLVGYSQALDLVTGGQRLDGEAAMRIGLANRLAPVKAGLSVALEWASKLADRPPEALRYAKACASLNPNAVIAPVLHGLVSSACQSAKGYRENTTRFS